MKSLEMIIIEHLENSESGGTLVNLLGGTVGAHPGEALRPKNRAAPLDIE